MANAKHTPGPWDVSFGRNDAAIHAGGTIAMIDDDAIAARIRTWKRYMGKLSMDCIRAD